MYSCSERVAEMGTCRHISPEHAWGKNKRKFYSYDLKRKGEKLKIYPKQNTQRNKPKTLKAVTVQLLPFSVALWKIAPLQINLMMVFK